MFAGVDELEGDAGFERLLDSVVRIDVWETVFAGGRTRTAHGVGSGVVMAPEGYVLTNAHVVNPYAERILVTLNNLERVPARLVGWDHWTDLAVVQLDMEEVVRRGFSFSYAQFGDSAALRPGETVYAVGTPNGLARTVTRGIISNTNRYFEGTQVERGFETGNFNTWLQTDAAINPGNSGGPLVLADGEVIGINTRSFLGSNNLSFAVPSNIAKGVIAELVAEGAVTRSYIGMVSGPMQDLESYYDLEANRGMLVQSVDPGSPADAAGLRPSDIVLSIDGQPVDGRFPEQLPAIRHEIASRGVGTEISFDVKRQDTELPLMVTTEELQSRVGKEAAFKEWGLSVQKLSRAVARERKLDTANGVVVIGVQPGFPAARAGLQLGDIITTVNRAPLVSLPDLEVVYDAYKEEPTKVLMEISRGHQTVYLIMKP